MGQTAPSSFVTAAAGLAPIADVLGGRPWRGLWATLRPTDHASGASGVHPTPEAPASRTVGSAAPVSPMCHIAPWMRLPLAPVGPPGAAGPFARILGVAAGALGALHCEPRSGGRRRRVHGVGRTQFLELGGSNPPAPASQSGLCGVISRCGRTADVPEG